MKKIVLMALIMVPLLFVNAQNYTDALRYGRDFSQGTARFNAMSGAFSALGGDMTAIGLNPAGSSIYLQNQLSFSTALYSKSNRANLNGTVSNSDKLDFNISNAGMVFVFKNYNGESPWKKFSFGFTYNQSASYENEFVVIGNTSNTLGNFFRSQANGYPLSLLQTVGGESITDLYIHLGRTEGVSAQNAFLGYQGYIIDPVQDEPDNTTYVSNTGSGSFRQGYYTYTDGFSGKYTLNMSTQLTNNFFLGLNINTHTIDYQQANINIERNSNANSSVKRIDFENYLSVLGNGFSFQLGGIAKVNETVRLSLYYDSPTWFTISEQTYQYLETDRLEDGIDFTTIVDPRISNLYGDYNLRTPYKLGVGGAYVFGGTGLISVDYSYKDYSTSKFTPSNNSYFANQNDTIKSLLTGSSTFKLGGEYRWNNLSFRGGYLYEQSPYKNTDLMGNRNGYSMGLGYNGGIYTLDFAYSHSRQESQQTILEIATYQRKSRFNNFIFTFNINL